MYTKNKVRGNKTTITSYYPNGVKESKVYITNGVTVKQKRWYDNGQLALKRGKYVKQWNRDGVLTYMNIPRRVFGGDITQPNICTWDYAGRKYTECFSINKTKDTECFSINKTTTHNRFGPAIRIWYFGTDQLYEEVYMLHNKYHCLHTAAIKRWDIFGRVTHKAYFIHGVQYTKERHHEATRDMAVFDILCILPVPIRDDIWFYL